MTKILNKEKANTSSDSMRSEIDHAETIRVKMKCPITKGHIQITPTGSVDKK